MRCRIGKNGEKVLKDRNSSRKLMKDIIKKENEDPTGNTEVSTIVNGKEYKFKKM